LLGILDLDQGDTFDLGSGGAVRQHHHSESEGQQETNHPLGSGSWMQRERDCRNGLRCGRVIQLGRDQEPSKKSLFDYKNVWRRK